MSIWTAFLLGLVGPTGPAPGPEGPAIEAVEFIGRAILPGMASDAGTRVGGLSGLAYDAASGLFLAISDDKGGPGSPAPRVYRLRIDLADGRLDPGGVSVEGHFVLKRADGSDVPSGAVDAEGIALAEGGGLFVSSEGMPGASPPAPPSIDRFDAATGRHRGALAVPPAYVPGPGRGVRDNLGFEALGLTPGGRFLDAATENALRQDGPAATSDEGSPSRVLRFDRASGRPVAEYAYRTEPVAGRDGGGLAGLVELLPIDESRWLAMERSYANGLVFTIRLFEVTTDGATDVRGVDALEGREGVVPLRKRLVLDLGTVAGLLPTNLEGMAFGPALPDGRRSLVLVGDNNLISLLPSQFVAFAVTLADGPVRDDRAP